MGTKIIFHTNSSVEIQPHLFFACIHFTANCQVLLPESCAFDHTDNSAKLLSRTSPQPFIFAFHYVFLPYSMFSLSFFSSLHLFPVIDILGAPPSLSRFPRRTSPLSGVVKQQRGVAVIARSWWEGPGTAGPILPNPGGMKTGQGGPLLTPGLLFL